MTSKKYSIDRAKKQITLHVPMTTTELCRLLIEEGSSDLVESLTWVPDSFTKEALRNGGFVEQPDANPEPVGFWPIEEQPLCCTPLYRVGEQK